MPVLVAATVLLLVAVGGTLAVGRAVAVSSPIVRRAVDLLEALLVASALPLALATTGVFELVRGL